VPRASPWASQERFGTNHDAATTKTTTAITHQEGGRQARTPIRSPSENATAAQNNGCGSGLWFSVIFQLDVSRFNEKVLKLHLQ
jgi:hypothetical protein